MRCRFFHNNSGQFLIFRRVVVVMSSSAMAVQNTVHVCIQNFRIFLSQPGRRCSRRGTKDHFHTHISSYIQKSVKEIIVEYTFVPLDLAPCKFCDSDYFDAVFQHSFQVVTPETFVPVFRVITSPQYQSFTINDLHKFLSFSIIYIYDNICCRRKCKEPYNRLFFHCTRCQT